MFINKDNPSNEIISSEKSNNNVFSRNVYKEIKWYKTFQVDLLIFLSFVLIILIGVYFYSYKISQENEIDNLKRGFLQSYDKIIAFNSVTSGLQNIKINNFNGDKILKIIEYLDSLGLESYNLQFDESLRIYYVDIRSVPLSFIEELKNNQTSLLSKEKTFSTINIVENNLANLKLIFN